MNKKTKDEKFLIILIFLFVLRLIGCTISIFNNITEEIYFSIIECAILSSLVGYYLGMISLNEIIE